MTKQQKRAYLIVLDSVGIGESPDAADYGDAGANTLAHVAEAVGGISLPTLRDMGLGNIPDLLPAGLNIRGVSPAHSPTASYGAMREVSKGKDTTTGHWEMAGLRLDHGFRLFPAGPPSFPDELVHEFERLTGRKVIGNKAASGTEIIAELGERQILDGSWIVYTSADSVFQIAAHEEVIPPSELHQACRIARELCNAHFVGRVIARPYVGKPGAFNRTKRRRDYSIPPSEPTVLSKLTDHGICVTTVGKLDDVFVKRGITKAIHMENNTDAQNAVLDLVRRERKGLIFANLIDFDMLYGHRRDASGYAKALTDTDAFIGEIVPLLESTDLLIVTADHGNDPTFKGTDHTREFVPLLVCRPGPDAGSLGIRHGFYDVAQTLASFFRIEPMQRGIAF